MEPIKSLKEYAKQIAKALDEKDNKKNRIESNEWNNVFNVEAKKGKRIERYITLENAEKSIMSYLIRCEKDRSKRLDLAEQWLNDLSEKADAEAEIAVEKDKAKEQSNISVDYNLKNDKTSESILFTFSKEADNESVAKAKADSKEPDAMPSVPEISPNITVAQEEVPELELTLNNLEEQEEQEEQVAQAEENASNVELPYMQKIDSQLFLTEEESSMIRKAAEEIAPTVLQEIQVTPAKGEERAVRRATRRQIAQNDSVTVIQSHKKYDKIIKTCATTNNLDPLLVKCIIYQESKFNPNAVSKKGAKGLMQLMPGTARGLGVNNAYDPNQNIQGGTRYFARLMCKYNNNMELALAAYNAGEGNVSKYGNRIPPFKQTQNYVREITSNYEKLKETMTLSLEESYASR